MALEQNEIKKVISVDLGNTTTSLKDYKKHIDELRGSLLQLDETSEEYKQISNEIYNEQQKLNEVMKVGKTQVDAEAGSYNALTKQMAELKKAWKSTGDEAKRNELGGQILEINNKLKDLDASTGNYQRNVGAYEQGFSKAMGSLKNGLTSSVPAFGKVNTAMKMIATNPIGLIITALVTAFMALKKAIAGSEEQSNRLHKAFAIFQPIINGIKNGISAIADGFVWLMEKASEAITSIIGWLKGLADFFGWDEWSANLQATLDSMEYANELEERQQKLTEQKRQNLVDEAQLRLEISELETKIADKQHYSEQERLAFLDEWEEKSKQIAQMRLDAATEEYNLIKETNELTESSTEDKQREAEAQARMLNEQRAFNEEVTAITRRRSQLLQKEEKTQKSINTELERQRQQQEQLIQQEQQKIEAIEQRLRDAKTTEIEKLNEQYEEEKALFEKYQKDLTELDEWYANERAKIEIAAEQTKYEELEKIRSEFTSNVEADLQQALFEIEQGVYDQSIQSEEDRQAAIYAVTQEALGRRMDALNLELENEFLTADQRATLMAEMDKLNREYANNEIKYDNEVAANAKAKAEQKKKDMQSALEGGLQIMSSVFDEMKEYYDEDSKEYKAIAIAQTTIDTLQGAIAAYKSMAGIPFVGPVLGAAAAAAAAAAGIRTIQQIKSTTKGSGGGGASSIGSTGVEAPSMASVTPLLDEQSDINRMNENNLTSQQEQQNIRVYVVDQDIRDANHKAQVVEDNTTF